MRNRLSLLAVALLSLGLGAPAAEAKGPADPCAFLTRRNVDRCLGNVLVPTRSADDEVTLDGELVGKGPMLLQLLTPGKHVVEVKPPGAKARQQAIIVLRGKSHVLPATPDASLTRPGAPALSEASFGFTDECDGVFHRHSAASLYPVDPDRLATLRADRALAPHLPTVASALARAETACRAGDAAACDRAGEQAKRGAGGRDTDAVRAAVFFRRGCDLHDRDSCVALADQLDSGWGVTRDPAAAAALRALLPPAK
jgi:hypothetical protein